MAGLCGPASPWVPVTVAGIPARIPASEPYSLVTRQIEPLSGPLDGGTLLTIHGRNLGRRLSDVAHGVWIGGVACEPLADRYTVSEE